MIDKLAYNATEAAAAIGVSREHLYKLAYDFKIEKRYSGQRMLFTHQALVKYLEGLPSLPPENPEAQR